MCTGVYTCTYILTKFDPNLTNVNKMTIANHSDACTCMYKYHVVAHNATFAYHV